MKRNACILLALAGFSVACANRKTSPDYDAVRQHSAQAQQDLDRQSNAPTGQ